MPISTLDFSEAGGGLRRMMDRFVTEGTLTGDMDEDAFLRAHAAAALLGLLYDQRVRAEYAFMGAKRLYDRLGHLDLARIADMDEGSLRELFAQPVAVHRFANKMAGYTRQVAQIIVDEYEGDASRLWADGASIETIQKRLQRLPGFGPGKSAKIKYVLHFLGYRDFAGEGRM